MIELLISVAERITIFSNKPCIRAVPTQGEPKTIINFTLLAEKVYTTEEFVNDVMAMQERYRLLFPKATGIAIESNSVCFQKQQLSRSEAIVFVSKGAILPRESIAPFFREDVCS